MVSKQRIIAVTVMLFYTICLFCSCSYKTESKQPKSGSQKDIEPDEDWNVKGNIVYFGKKEVHNIESKKTSDGWFDMSVVDVDTVYVAYFSDVDGTISVDKTYDGGETWMTSCISYKKYAGIGAVYISFFNRKQGYIFYCSDPGAGLENEILFFTDDGAETFYMKEDLSDKIENYVTDMAFLNKDKGIILVSYHGTDVYAYQTKNGGKEWKSLEVTEWKGGDYINGISIEKNRNVDSWTLCLQMVTDDRKIRESYISKDDWKTWLKE